MDKQNYIIKEIKSQDIKHEFKKIEDKIISKLKSKKLIQRRRVLKDYRMLYKAIRLLVVKHLSYQRLADVMAYKYQVVMSDTAWKKQLRKASPIYLEAVQECLEKQLKRDTQENKIYRKSYAIDATDIAQEGNNKTVMRVHTMFSLNDHIGVYTKITDNHTSENIKHFPISAGNLYLADRAYGKVTQISEIIKQNADFIIRISPSHIKLYTDRKCSKRADFLSLTEQNSFSSQMFIKHRKEIYPVRVIGEKIPEDKCEKAIKRVKRRSSKNGHKIRNTTIRYSQWLIVIASQNLPFTPTKILSLYKARWQIELFFKRAKSLLGIKKIRYSSKEYSKSFIELWLGTTLALCILQLICFSCRKTSMSDFNIFSLLREFIS